MEGHNLEGHAMTVVVNISSATAVCNLAITDYYCIPSSQLVIRIIQHNKEKPEEYHSNKNDRLI